jgi:pimeloyl-ACP methyl ester carboxylesterase
MSSRAASSTTLVNKLIFPAPISSYGLESYSELIWIPEVDFQQLVHPIVYQKREKPVHWETGRKIPALFINSECADYLVLFYHGNGEDIGGSYKWLSILVQLLAQNGIYISVLIVEYPGYGLCFGKPNEAGVLQNAESAYYFARAELQWPVENLWLWGVSIGTGPATFLAARYEAGALILMAAYESIRDVVKHLLGTAASYLISNRFQNNKEIESVTCPTMLIHGKKDQLIPHQQSEKLFELCKSNIKKLVLPEDVTHSNFALDQHVAIPLIEFIIEIMEFRSKIGLSIESPPDVIVPDYFLIPPEKLPSVSPKRGSRSDSSASKPSIPASVQWFLSAITKRKNSADGKDDVNNENKAIEADLNHVPTFSSSRRRSAANAENNSNLNDSEYGSPLQSPIRVSNSYLQQLVSMGFDENSSRDALKKFRNDFGATLDYLTADNPDYQ